MRLMWLEVWSECRNGKGEWGEMFYMCEVCVFYIRGLWLWCFVFFE